MLLSVVVVVLEEEPLSDAMQSQFRSVAGEFLQLLRLDDPTIKVSPSPRPG